MLSPDAAALRSQPALKTRSPAAVTIPTRSSSSSRSRENASCSARLVATSIALTGGRSIVITSIWPTVCVLTGISASSSRTQQRPSDNEALDLARPVPDPLYPRVPPPPLDRHLAHQPHPAEHLHGRRGHPATPLPRPALRPRSRAGPHPLVR